MSGSYEPESAGSSAAIARRLGRAAGFALLRFVFPSLCFACRQELGNYQFRGACVCCWAGLAPWGTQVCPTCALPRPGTTDLLGPARGRCARCVLDPSPLSSVQAAVPYDETARRFLLRAKLGLHRELLVQLSEQMILRARRSPDLVDCNVVVPVPSHPWARLRRGFEPAAELAAPLARALGLPLKRGLLVRRARVGGLKRMGALQRERAARVAFRSRACEPGTRVLLVDDVMTTGATLSACANALLRGGATRVRALVWARTP